MSLFGQSASTQNTAAAGGGLFGGGNAGAAQGATGGSIFGQNTQNQQGGTGSSLFGGQNTQNANNTTSGGLFGNAGGQQQQQQNQAAATGTGLFGQSTQNQGTTTGTGLFGQNTQNRPAGTGLFGQAAQNQNATGMGLGGGMFGQQTQQNQQSQQKSSLFGGSTLVGRPTQATAFGGQSGAPQSSLFGGSILGTQQQQQQQQQPMMQGLGNSSFGASRPSNGGQHQPAGAYFDSLIAKSQKASGGRSSIEDLPSLELGLGDLRSRLRKLQSKPNDRPLQGKAHYLLAASGVDPGVAAKDLGVLDAQSVRAERAAQASTPSDVDVDRYLANLQSKTTMAMIHDGIERSLRDFDTFVEENMQMEWDAQRKRIFDHFGIKPRDNSSTTREIGFGRSRRSKSQGGAAASRGPRNSTFGKSHLQRSVIGTPSRIGMHKSEFADVDRSDGVAATQTRNGPDDRVLRERQANFAEKVRNLNAARLLKRPFAILSELAEVEKKSYDPHAPHVTEAYLAMMEIVGEDPDAGTTLNMATAKEREFVEMYLDENPNSANSMEMRRRILAGSTQFLEKQFLREVESLVAKHPHEAMLGGLPDITSKIKAYIRLRSARKDLVPDNTELQQVQGECVWAVVFYLLRSGHVSDAAKYVNDNSNQFRGIDRTFATYLNSYASSEDRRITNRKLLDRCTNEYVQRSRNAPENSIDPFRMACYKVIGRIELSNRNLEGLNTDINDWIWLQFNLAREGDRAMEMAGESYSLMELQSSIREIGLKHFPKANSEDTNGSFGMFFYLQILSGLFEDAIAYLYPFNYVDAVHFGLALEFYGLLRPSDPVTGSNDLRSHSVKNIPQLNFGRMIGYYTRDFRAADVVSAVDYLTLICLNQDLDGEAGRRQAELCHEALRELVLETREFSQLLGDIMPDGRRTRGVIEERGPLIGLDAESDYINTMTLQAASFADDNGRTTDAVLLYHLAGEYDTVVEIVSRALSEAISLEIGDDPMRLEPAKPRSEGAAAKVNGQGQQQQSNGTSLTIASIDDPIELAKTMVTMYERDAMFYRRIKEQNQVACRVLLEMSHIKKLVEASQWAQSLDKIRSLEVLPLEAGGDASIIRAYASNFTSLAQTVSINVPNLLMWTILCCVKQRERLTDGGFSGNEGTKKMMADQLRQIVLDLTTYTSQLRYRFPQPLHEALARASAE